MTLQPYEHEMNVPEVDLGIKPTGQRSVPRQHQQPVRDGYSYQWDALNVIGGSRG